MDPSFHEAQTCAMVRKKMELGGLGHHGLGRQGDNEVDAWVENGIGKRLLKTFVPQGQRK